MKVTNLQISKTLQMLKENNLACADVRIVMPALEELLDRRLKESEEMPHDAVRCEKCFDYPIIRVWSDYFSTDKKLSYYVVCRCGNSGTSGDTQDEAISNWNIEQQKNWCLRNGIKCTECVEQCVPDNFEAKYMRGRPCREFMTEWDWRH